MNPSRYECIQKCLGRRHPQETEPNCGRSENRSTDRQLRDPEFNAGAKGEEEIFRPRKTFQIGPPTAMEQGQKQQLPQSLDRKHSLSISIPPSPAQQYAAQDRQSSPGETYIRKMVVVDKLHLPSTPSPKGKHTTSSYRLVGWELRAASLSDL